LRSHEKITWLL